jgi:hypothetical protein
MKILVGLALAIAIPGVLLTLEFFDWLDVGQWTPVPLSALIGTLEGASWRAESLGAAKIVDALLEFPLSLTSFGLGLIILIFPTRKSFN